MKWKLSGTAAQIAILQGALDDIKFPWDRLKITWMPVMGFRDLNSGFALRGEEPQKVSIDNQLRPPPRAHGGEFHGTEGKPEPLNGELEGRRFTYAVFYPGSARIFVDYRLERYPDLARASVSAEVAHAVDEFMPLTEAQRNDIILLLGGRPGEMTWWERFDYGTEYWTLAGEHFMPLFTNAYSEIPFGDTSSFMLDPSKVNPHDLVRIMGVPRTDYVAPTPPPPPPPPELIIAPEEVIIPVEPPAPVSPEPHVHQYRRYGKSKILHKPTHYPKKTKYDIFAETKIPTGFVACKQCKPH